MNGRIRLRRRWWFWVQTGSLAPADALVDRRGESVTLGVREMACRENQAAPSFDKAAENLARTAQLVISGEQLRILVVAEGCSVQAAQQAGVIHGVDGRGLHGGGERPKSAGKNPRLYTGCDGVMVPVITQAEKDKRRVKVKEKRRKCGRKRRPLPPSRKGADRAWKEFKVVYFYDEDLQHQQVAVTPQNHKAAGRLLQSQQFGRRLEDDSGQLHVVEIELVVAGCV